MTKIGVIGYGLRISTLCKRFCEMFPDVKITAIADPRKDELAETLGPDIRFYADAEAMLDGEKLDGVMIGTRCNLHTELAIKVMERQLPLFLEKPVSTNFEDLHRLKEADEKYRSPVVVSFPLRNTPLVQRVKELLEADLIGKVEHVQAVNNVPYGGVYFHNWYRDESITGGLFLQKATHDFDYINYLLGERAKWIAAVKSKQIFKGDMPAGLRCEDCEKLETCPESIVHQRTGPYCAFAEDTGNEDSGSALIQYESGMHAVYSQNFFVRKTAGKRGARLMGFKGTLEFDWYANEIVHHFHHANKPPDRYPVNVSLSQGHGGGDAALLTNFLNVIRGEEASTTPLEDGLYSALMCLKATVSAETRTFQEISYAR